MPAETRYTQDHEWVRLDGDIATIGITAYAAEQLGDVVFVELPEVGRAGEEGRRRGGGRIGEGGERRLQPGLRRGGRDERALADNPRQRQRGAGGRRLVREDRGRRSRARLDGLLDEAAYQDFVETL